MLILVIRHQSNQIHFYLGVIKTMADSKAQPGSHESGTGGETNTPGGDSQVKVQDVLNTKTTGKPPENANS